MQDCPILSKRISPVILWMRRNKIENLWNEENTSWEHISLSYKLDDFYILSVDGNKAGCIAITDYDEKYWKDIPKGESLYVHKLAVKRSYAGMGLSGKLIEFAKDLARKRNRKNIRLDFNKKRDKLRKIYEKNGFRYEKEVSIDKKYSLYLYVCNLA